jgi:hypothetical protein
MTGSSDSKELALVVQSNSGLDWFREPSTIFCLAIDHHGPEGMGVKLPQPPFLFPRSVFWGFSKAHTGASAVLVDELDADVEVFEHV